MNRTRFPFARPSALIALALGLVGSPALLGAAEAQTVIRGPYLQKATPSSFVVRWRTDVPTDSRVLYGTVQGSLGSSVTDPTVTTEHVVEVATGLAADTRYYYAVGTSTTILAGDTPDFFVATHPAVGTPKTTRAWIVGDSGTANLFAVAVRDAFVAYNGATTTDLWLMLGDNAYSSGTDAEYQAAVFNMYTVLLRKIVLWPTLGNHDGNSADSATQTGPYYDIFTLPTAGEAGGVASGTEAYYSFDYGNIHFICLESHETDRSPGGAMMTWLANDLAATTAKWIVAFWHHPPYTKGSHNSDGEGQLIQMRENALPILESYNVDLVLTGHSHSYERSFLVGGHYGVSATLTGDMVINGGDGVPAGNGAYTKPGGAPGFENGAVYAVAGSSGQISGGQLNHPVMFKSLNELGSLVLDVSGDDMTGTFINNIGAVRDTFTIRKGADTVRPTIVSVDTQNETTVEIEFAERLDAFTAEDDTNYTISGGVAVTGASLGADQRTVTLTTSAMPLGPTLTLTVSDVEDQAGNPILPGTQKTFVWDGVFEIAFQDGVAPTGAYAGTRDTTMSQADPATNLGAATVLLLDGDDPPASNQDKSVLVKWDVSAIPAGATVLAASITFDVTNNSDATYTIFEMLRPWVESTATWNQFDAGQPWQTAGAFGALDRGATGLGFVRGEDLGSYTVGINATGLALIEDWVDGVKVNNGFVISDVAAADGLDVSSSEAASAVDRPRLSVTYSTVAPGCGNGIIEPGETCDDGNTTGGDGCSATCQIESPCGTLIVSDGSLDGPAAALWALMLGSVVAAGARARRRSVVR